MARQINPILPLLGAAVLTACATGTKITVPEPTRFVEQQAPAGVASPVVLPSAVRDGTPPETERSKVRPTPEQARALVNSANLEALDLPTPECFKGKACEYWYDPEQHYLVYMAVLNQTLVRMQPGETVLDVIAPGAQILIPHERFHYGTGNGRTELVAFMPREAGLKQQVSILTDRRKYDLQIETYTKTHHVEVRWRYLDALIQPVGGPGGLASAYSAQTDRVTGLAPRDRYCGYHLSGGTPKWRPTQTPDGQPPVCDDGEVMVVNFPVGLGAIGAPALWRVTAEGRRSPVQFGKVNATYRVAGIHEHLVLEMDGEAVDIRRGHSENGNTP